MHKLSYNTFCMKVGIYLNDKYFSEKKRYTDKILSAFPGSVCKTVNKPADLRGSNFLFVLGGDGTILSVAADCAKSGVKIIGVNYGHMGFLAEFEPDRFDEAVERVASGNYEVQSRAMLKINIGKKEFLALNDLVVQRCTSGTDFRNTVSLHAEIDGTTVDNFSSDGIIVSTPTGSTAYSLAAGGSVLAPDIDAFILTPICPHSLHSRPVVFGDKSTLKLSLVNKGAPIRLIVDGKVVGELSYGEEVKVSKSDYCAEFITAGDKNFFNKLLIKLNIWSK